MQKASLVISGVSSFTGLWIAKALSEAGYSVRGLCSRKILTDYEGLSLRRLKRAQRAGVELVFGARADDGSMARWVRQNRFETWIHHHHFMEAFRSSDYNVQSAKRVGIDPLPELVESLKEAGVKRAVYSGTYFEKAETPYGKSKREVAALLKELTAECDIEFSRVTIANPIGPFENSDRLIPMLIQASRRGETFTMKAPTALNYTLPVSALTQSYCEAVTGKAESFEPSLGSMTNRELAERALEELIRKRLGLTPCKMTYENSVPVPATEFRAANMSCDWPSFWDFYAAEERE